ncbi:MAG: murein biosynthesis integral membrane protein MurJ [Phycisphaerales bacterium]|nr:murein biosynthesis integral membrane protein MurJ [Phycisphaerales bacterium]
MARQHSRFLGSARLIAVCTLVSRVTGLARDMTMNHIYGQGWVQDAFNYGFLIPNLFRRLFGEGALSAVFVPVFTDVLDKKGRDAAWTLLGRVTGLMVFVLSLLVIVLELVVLAVYQWSDNEPMRDLQIGLTAVMVPFMIGICLVALFAGILNCIQHFAVPALLPIVLNVMIITGAIVIGPMFGNELKEQAYGVGLCVTAASVLQLIIIIPVLRRNGVRIKLSLDRNDKELRRMIRMFIPIVLGHGLLLLNSYFDALIITSLTQGPEQPESFSLFSMEIAYPLHEGALSAVYNAQRLYQFPLGVLAISLATAVFPTFSLFASRKDMPSLRSAVSQSLRLAIFVGLPSGLMLIILGEPIITLLFEHGRFDHDDTVRASNVLRWYGLVMTAFCCQHILLRGFYSLKDTITPMKISCWLVGLNLALNLALVWSLHEQAFGIATAITATLHVCISVWLLRRRLDGRLGAKAISLSAARTVTATAVASFAAWYAHDWIRELDLGDFGNTGIAAVRVFGPLAGAIASFFLISLILRMEEPRWLLRRVPAESA